MINIKKKCVLFAKLRESGVKIHKCSESNANHIIIDENQIIELSNYLNVSYDEAVKMLRDYFEGYDIEKQAFLKQLIESILDIKIRSFHISKSNLENETLTYSIKATLEPQIEFINVEFKISEDGK